VVDGLDQLRDEDAGEIRAGLTGLAEDPDLVRLQLVVTSREAGPDVTGGQQFAVDMAGPQLLARYLEGRRLPHAAADMLATACSRGAGGWLLARLIADTHAGMDDGDRETLLEQLYQGGEDNRRAIQARLFDRLLDQCGADDAGEWVANLLPILTPLVAAGVGPVVPLDLLCAASDWLDGPDQPGPVRAVLTRLGRLVVRSKPGTDRELVGLFHPALVEHLTGPARRPLDAAAGRRVILNEIEELAPVTGIYIDNPLYRWAAESEPEHLWQTGEIGAALRTLRRRPLPTPRENLARWTTWLPRVQAERGPEHLDTLTTRGNIAFWTGRTGDPADALRLFRELLPDQRRVLGPHHPDTLTTRNNIKYWSERAESGDGEGEDVEGEPA
jgi:hypothetical protein